MSGFGMDFIRSMGRAVRLVATSGLKRPLLWLWMIRTCSSPERQPKGTFGCITGTTEGARA